MERVSTNIQQGRQVLEMTAKVIEWNVSVFNIVLDIQHFITKIPGQIERQQPVYLVDAIGHHTPFYLEFVKSAEALTFVLQDNFREVSSGACKIQNGEFAIQDSGTGKDFDLASNWEICFSPGQRVDMSMVFTTGKVSSPRNCPKCGNHCAASSDYGAYSVNFEW